MPREWLVRFEEGFSKPKPLFEDNLLILFHPMPALMRGDQDRLEADFMLSSCSI